MTGVFRDTVTLYRHVPASGGAAERWERTVLRGVLWRERRERAGYRGDQAFLSSVVIVTVPKAADPGGEISVSGLTGMVLGECRREIGAGYTPADLRRDEPSYCMIGSVVDARNRAWLPHRRLISAPRPSTRVASI